MAGNVQIAFDLPDHPAAALAQFVKRVGWSQMRECAVDDETRDTRDALEQVRRSLAEVGYALR